MRQVVWWLALALLVVAAAPAAAETQFTVYADLDANPATGCTVDTADGPFAGVETAVVTTVDTSDPPQVTGVIQFVCAGGTLVAAPGFVPDPPLQWPVGVGLGVGGSDVVETYLELPPSSQLRTLRLGFTAVILGNTEGEDALLAADGGAGPPLLVVCGSLLQIPTLGEVGMLALVTLLAAAALLRLRRSPAGPRAAALLLGFALAAVAWAAIVRDGAVGDWGGAAPLGTDAVGDAPINVDIHAVFAQCEGDVLQLRIDADLGSAGIDIEKSTNGEDADTPPGPTLAIGSPVLWAYLVANTGDVALSNVQVTDDQGVEVSCPETVLPAGESMTCFAAGTAAEGQYANVGSAVGTPPSEPDVGDSDPSHYFGQIPPASIDIEKITNGEDADDPPGPSVFVEDPVLWTYVVTNTGGVTLTDVQVTDDQGVAVSCPQTTLLAGESMNCTGNGFAESGQYANVGSVVGTPPSGPDVTDSDPSHYFGEVPGASIDLEKFTNGEDADEPPGPFLLVEDQVQWTYVVTNNGGVTLTGIQVTDDQGVAVSCPKTTLVAGESMTCTGNGFAEAGQYANVGSVVGTPPSGPDVIDSDPSHYFGEFGEQ